MSTYLFDTDPQSTAHFPRTGLKKDSRKLTCLPSCSASILIVFFYNSFPRSFDIHSLLSSKTHHLTHQSALASALEFHNYVKRPYAAFHRGSHWPGWSGIDHLIVFGDSWTTTATELDGPMPSPENPFGNPDFPGAVSTNGPNWLGYFVTLYNETFVKALNIAAGGATIDMDLIAPEGPHEALRPFKMQVHDQFVPQFSNPPPEFGWRADDTLVIIWIGLNDLHNANDKTQQYFGIVWEEFADCVDQIYQAGVRNFLIMNVPPIERAPLAEIIHETDRWTGWVDAWNKNTTDLATNLTNTYPDTSMFIFDTYTAYDEAIDDPCTFPETCHYRDTTTFCWACK